MRSRLAGTAVAGLLLASACGGATAPWSPSQAPPAATLRVLAAASLTDAFTEAAAAFTRAGPGAEIAFGFASSSTLATQIVNGAAADVFASADEASMRKVVDAGLVDGTPVVFAASRLAIAVAPGNPLGIGGLADLSRPGLVVVVAGPSVPAGRYAAESLAKAGVTLRPASHEVDVRAVLHKVAMGEADAGIVYATDVAAASARVSSVEIPGAHQVLARYPIAVVRGSRDPRLARAFIDHLLSAEGQGMLARFGFARP